MFDRASRETEELIDDLDSLGGLVAQGASPAREALAGSDLSLPGAGNQAEGGGQGQGQGRARRRRVADC